MVVVLHCKNKLQTLNMNTMKTPIYKPGAIKLIQIITLLFGLQINLLFAVNPTENNPTNHFSKCVTCSYSVLEIQKEELLSELILLTPTTPAEATFSDETAPAEINLAPSTPAETSFDNDPEYTNPSTVEYLAPTTPEEADYND
jgi:hypothetical protein